MGIGITELILILVVVLLVFGGRKLPEIGRSLGNGLREFRKAMKDISEEGPGSATGGTEGETPALKKDARKKDASDK